MHIELPRKIKIKSSSDAIPRERMLRVIGSCCSTPT